MNDLQLSFAFFAFFADKKIRPDLRAGTEHPINPRVPAHVNTM